MEITMSEEDFDADLDAQLAEDVDTFDVEVAVNGRLVSLHFSAMDGLDWADLAAQCPPNLKIELDRSYGYSLRAMVLLATPLCAKRMVNGEPVETTEEQWTKFFRGMKGAGHRQIGNALYILNEYLPALAVEEAKKASQVGSRQSSDSPAASVSLLLASSDMTFPSAPDTSMTTPGD